MPVCDLDQVNPLNPLDPPRVLVYVRSNTWDRLQFCRDLPGTYRFISHPNEVDLREWDALITDSPVVFERLHVDGTRSVERDIPPSMCVLLILYDNSGATLDTVEDSTEAGFLVAADYRVPGHHLYRSYEPASESLKALVKRDLQTVAQNRSTQFGVRTVTPFGEPVTPSVAHFTPFLRGPDDLTLAGRIRHQGGGSVWIVPADVNELESWWRHALQDWHQEYGSPRFPGVPNWSEAEEWMTHEERQINRAVEDAEAAFAIVKAEHEGRIEEYRSAADAAREKADNNERVLLIGQGDPLQDAVLGALQTLGFTVRDMDKEWDDKARREDYRIEDPDSPGWLAIGDATGTAKGAKASKHTALTGFGTKYVLEERPAESPYLWMIVNRKIQQDPNTRGELFREDEAASFAINQGLAIDTVALFLLVNSVNAGEIEASDVRAWLRLRTGELLIDDAREWLQANTKGDPDEAIDTTT